MRDLQALDQAESHDNLKGIEGYSLSCQEQEVIQIRSD